MSDQGQLLASLLAALIGQPGDVPLRRHVVDCLIAADRAAEAIQHIGVLLAADPTDQAALSQLAAATTRLSPKVAPRPIEPPFDWSAAEEEVADLAPPVFASGDQTEIRDVVDRPERPTLRLADVGGMGQVKARLDAAFLAPLRNPELRALYAKSLRGGLLLYGPPGCGKTFLARALAGELGASFYSVSLADVLDMYVGQSERNLRQVFETVRRYAPCVLFLDEIDALGHKRSQLRGEGMRGTVNQLLTELDGVSANNEGVFVLAATNHPWDIDSALRRPGRIDRMLLVAPPDVSARTAILRHHLKDRPLAAIDLDKLSRATDGYSGADIAHLCDAAAEVALLGSARTGKARLIEMGDFSKGLKEIRPSTKQWFLEARNVAMFANESGEYDELLAYMKANRLA